MNEFLIVIIIAETVFIFLLLSLFFIKCKKSEEKKDLSSNWTGEIYKSKRIKITNIALEDINKWSNPQIKLWLSNPIGVGLCETDKKFPLEGKVFDPPQGGSVKIYVILSDKEVWYQGHFPLNEQGEWKGWIYLNTEDGEAYRKIIRIELYDSMQSDAKLLDIKDIIIE